MKEQKLQNQKDYNSGNQQTCRFSVNKPPFLSDCCVILKNIRDGIFSTDRDKRIQHFNHAAEDITGFTSEQAVGQYCYEIFRTNICETGCPLDRIFSGENTEASSRVLSISRAGQKKFLNVNGSAIIDNQGRLIGGAVVFQDRTDFEQLRREASQNYTHEDIIGRHPAMRKLLSTLPDVAESDSPVLIQGPSGSGKELFARAIHSLSSRQEQPFLALNCAAFADTLLESELFGHVRGAFTGAEKNRAGYFFRAHEGTLFLDEICNASPVFQADVLRVLEDGEFTPVGGTQPEKADFRIVAGTNRDLKKMVEEGNFRDDLYFRLNVVTLELPLLKQRKEDIPPLIEGFIHRFNLLKNKSIHGISAPALSALMEYDFSGNVRELRNIIEHAFIFCNGPLIELDHLPFNLPAPGREKFAGSPDSPAGADGPGATKIGTALKQCDGNRSLAAKMLGISRATLWRRMKNYGLLPEHMKQN